MNRTALAIALVLLGALGYSAWKTWEQAVAYEEVTLSIIAQLETGNRVEQAVDRLLDWLSLGVYHVGEDRIARLNDLKQLQQAYRASVHIMTGAFFALIPPFLFALWRVRRTRLDVGYGLLLAGFAALLVGLSAPILSVEASKSLPLLGQTVFQFESKGVLSTIGTLMDSGNLWLAILLFLFSVAIPVFKTLVVALTFFAPDHQLSVHGLRLSKGMGKWSMADVFVVAIIVAFFSTAGNGLTRAEVQAGLYFFAGYVVLSLVATQIIAGVKRDA